MSKIAETKALEAFPVNEFFNNESGMLEDSYRELRIGYEVGYDQAMQDFMEKTEKLFNEELFTRFNGAEYFVASNKCMNLLQFIEYFRNYMKN